MITWVVGDIHFGSDGMFDRIYKNNFSSKEAYMESFIQRYNSMVKSRDHVIFLGDLGKENYLKKYLPKLKGKKSVILGNHDTLPLSFYQKYFKTVYQTPVFIHERIVLSHEPVPVEPGVINGHGHTHYIFLDSPLHFNLCIEHTDFAPVHVNTLAAHFKMIPEPNKSFLNEWFKDIQIWRGPNSGDLILDENQIINIEKTILLRQNRKE